jgi:subtilisin family serine protease
VSPNQVIPADNGALSPIAERILKVPTLTYEVGREGIVIAVKAELIVRTPALQNSAPLRQSLEQVAEHRGTLASIASRTHPTEPVRSADFSGAEGAPAETEKHPDPDYEPRQDGPVSHVEIWRLTDETRNSIDESRRLRALVRDECVKTPSGDELFLPAVSPNHVAILAPRAGGCPAAPPQPAHAPDEPFVRSSAHEPAAKVTILDSGYIYIEPPHTRHQALDERVTLVAGQSLDTSTNPASWQPDRPDDVYTDPAGQLDGISGHGTFIAGLISHIAPHTRLEVVGLRNQEVEIGDLNPGEQLGLFETEAAIAHAMLQRCDTDVIQCGFAFPTLDDYPSVPFAAAMAELRQSNAPRGGRVAVVAPAGNEQSRLPYWPAALPDVIGVASTNRRRNARAWFSNWGGWCDCCARGDYVYSTFVYWDGPVEGEPLTDVEHFSGWARWDGTSFAAPKVSAEIARLVAEDPDLAPTDAWDLLISSPDVRFVTDYTLSPHDGVTLPRISEPEP